LHIEGENIENLDDNYIPPEVDLYDKLNITNKTN
jgi:hypothetical protein